MTVESRPPHLVGPLWSSPRKLAAAMFAWAFASAVLARLWRAGGLWLEADADDGFVWMPLGLAADLLFSAILAGIVRTVAWRKPRVAGGVGIVLGLAHIAWLALNLVSFTLTQAPITFQRARGDEGVKLDAHNLLRIEDVIPAIGYSAAALLALPAALFAARAIAGTATWRRVAAAIVAALLAYGADTFFFRVDNFGVADHAAFTLLSSFIDGELDEIRKPKLGDAVARDRAALLEARHPRVETAPPPRGRAGMQNVVIVFAEGISRKHTSLAGTDATPNLLRRAKETGLELTRYHSPYHKSIAAIFSAVCSMYPPPNGQNIVELNGRIDCGELSDVLKANGIHAGVFHGGDFGFYDKLMLLGMRGYETMQDSRTMSDPLVFPENEWGIDDRATVRSFLEWVDTLPPGDRFGGFLIPITAHWPYWIPDDVEQPHPPTSSKNEFLNAVHFLDGAFEELMQGLEARGLADETAVIYLADHGETVGERPRASAGRRLAYEPSLHVPFVILAPGMWPGGAQSDRLGSHVDLLPTVLDLLALPPDPRHEGTSLLAPDREPGRMFIGASNGPKSVGFLDGDHKFVVNRSTGQREAYNLATDPDERRNIIDTLPAAEQEQLEQEALAFAEAHLEHLKTAPRTAEELDIDAAFIEVADVRLRRGDEVVPCLRVPASSHGARACPGEDAAVFQGRRTVKADGTHHDCLVVAAPRSGVLEIEVRDQPWLPFLTRIRVVQTDPKRLGDETVPVEAWSDGLMEGRRLTKTTGHARMPFAYPREELRIRVGGTGTSSRDICIAITERGWRNKPIKAKATPEPGAPTPP